MRNSGYYLPDLSLANKTIMIVVGSLFIISQALNAIGSFSLTSFLGVSGAGVKSGLIFQPFTYFLIEKSFLSTLFNLLMVWFIGSDIENRFGTKMYLKLLALAVFVPGIIYAFMGATFFAQTSLAQHVLYGLTTLNFVLCAFQATLEPHRIFSFFFVFPLRAIHFCGLLVLMEIYSIFAGFGIFTAWIHILGLGIGWLMVKGLNHPVMNWYLQSGFGSLKMKKVKKSAQHLKLIKPDDSQDNNPRYWQ